mmetsp:Transcript_1617/g.3121  ORF Transcript_1617/g.3121 Transcript_1617/m.3121 type:complete len:214 (-) Transcript_1617:726-1367(-)
MYLRTFFALPFSSRIIFPLSSLKQTSSPIIGEGRTNIDRSIHSRSSFASSGYTLVQFAFSATSCHAPSSPSSILPFCSRAFLSSLRVVRSGRPRTLPTAAAEASFLFASYVTSPFSSFRVGLPTIRKLAALTTAWRCWDTRPFTLSVFLAISIVLEVFSIICEATVEASMKAPIDDEYGTILGRARASRSANRRCCSSSPVSRIASSNFVTAL